MIDFTIRQELTGVCANNHCGNTFCFWFFKETGVERWVGGWRSTSIFFGTQCTLEGAALTASVSRSVVRWERLVSEVLTKIVLKPGHLVTSPQCQWSTAQQQQCANVPEDWGTGLLQASLFYNFWGYKYESGKWSAKRTNPRSGDLGLIYRVFHGISWF